MTLLRRALVATCLLPLLACSDDTSSDDDTGIRRYDTGIDTTDDASRDTVTPPDADTGEDAGGDVDEDVDDADADAGGDAPLDTDRDADTSGEGVGPEGRTIIYGPVRLTIPPNALSERVEITIIEDPDAAPEGFLFDTEVFRFEPEGLEFAIPFEVCFTLDGVRPANFSLFWTNEDAAGFAPLAAQDQGRQVCGRTDHFSHGFVGGHDDDRCLGIDCPTTIGRCNGTVAVPPTLAICRFGECFIGEYGTDCADLGLLCVDGFCTPPPECGNGLRETGEDCDGADLGGNDCTTYSWTGGTLGCTDTCEPDLSACTGDPCDDVTCTPPAPVCVGNSVVESVDGTCFAGVCQFAEEHTDCGESGQVCLDGECVAGPFPGAIVITEFLNDIEGNDDGYEWFELYNTTTHDIGLRGMVVSDDGIDSFTVAENVTIEAESYVVFGSGPNAAPVVDYVWNQPEFIMANGDDEIVLEFAGLTIDRIAYDGRGPSGWPDEEGIAASLAPGADDNSTYDNWCLSRAQPFGDGPERGSPRAANPPCDGECGDGYIDFGDEECDDGNTDPDDGCDESCRFEIDPCAGVSCPTPDDECDGDTAVVYAGPGTCVEGICEYETTETVCTDTDEVCGEGACVDVAPGDLIITEIMANVYGGDGGQEWFEVYNPGAEPVELDGLVLRDNDGERATIRGDYQVPAESYFVFGAHEDAAPESVDVVWASYGTFSLGNGSDEIILTRAGVEIDRVVYHGAWPIEEGVAAALSSIRMSIEENDNLFNWCGALLTYGNGENLGSPGAANASCGECGDGDLNPGEACDDGNTTPGDGCDATCEEEECADDRPCEAAPAAYCDGNVVVSYVGTGTCNVGVCEYTEAGREDCETDDAICVGGACHDGPIEGQVIVSEYMNNPDGSDDDQEWIELHNLTSTPISLQGLVISDGADDVFTVTTEAVLPANGYIVFGEHPSAAGGAVVETWPADFLLSNSRDKIILTLDGVELDRVEYNEDTGWDDGRGASIALDPAYHNATDNNFPGNWCNGITFYDERNTGSPGEANPDCGF